MPILLDNVHIHTPTLTVSDPRGLAVRSVAHYRSIELEDAEERVNRSAHDALGYLVEQWDPRLWALRAEDAATPANLSNRYSLSGKVLGSISVDAGERISLFGDGDQLVQSWDSRGSERQVEYDDLLRPLAIFEQGDGEVVRCTERYEYAGASVDFTDHNQCGQLIRHDDPAGTQTLDEYALTGGVLEQTQRFLSALETPDWPSGLPERDALLEPEAAISSSSFNPLGDVLEQTDAKGNRQLFEHTFAGQLLATYLQLHGQATPQVLVSAIVYSAYGQVEQETAGNDVVSTLTYRPEDGRLMQLAARHGTDALQDLRYAYDPVGNVLSIEDAALPIRYFANQRVEPKKYFGYDSLYQLKEATGWEAGSASRGPGFNRFDDPGAVANYQQTYRYDAGGNLVELVHVGPQSHSRKLTAARYSNRCLPEKNDRPPTEDEIAAAFDGNGNLLELQPGQVMSWDLRNQLREVRPVEREGANDDRELYWYGGDGMRRRKIRSTQTNARALISEVRYLPGLEIRTHAGTGEVLQVICVQAGRSAMQVLHWETSPPSGIDNDQYRYNLADHLGSSSLELDSDAEVISQESYHPYGSTAWFAGRSEVEASYKIVRYSGKERDATGLYYYGFRYYAPWLQRWINPDPMGEVDGLNMFFMCAGNPIVYRDNFGLNKYKGKYDFAEMAVKVSRGEVLARGVTELKKSYSAEASRFLLGQEFLKVALDEAVNQVSNSDISAEYKKLPERLLGRSESWQEIQPLLLERFKVLREAASEYREGENQEQFAFVRSKKQGELAFTNKSDPNKRIFITEFGLQQSPIVIAMTLGHELSHLKLDSHDFFYYERGHRINPKSHERVEADRVAQGAMDAQLADMASKRVPVDVLREIFDAKKPAGIQQALQGNPALRSQILLNNADTLALLVFAFGHSAVWSKMMSLQ
jgi:insecticidal toxin complex protein TccC